MKILEEFEKLKKREDIYRYPNNPKNNPYVALAECFEFYPWLLKLLENEENIRKSIVLSFLYDNEFDKKLDELKEFVLKPFRDCKTQNEISQKWHYFIAWYLLEEYWGIIGRKDGIKDFENTTVEKVERGFRNKELKEWLQE